MSYNKFIVMGRLTREPEPRSTPGGTPLCEFGIAYDVGFGDKKKPVFFEVTAWGKTSEFVIGHFHKGDGIHIDGRIEMDSWVDANTGKNRQKHHLIAERVTFPVGNKNAGKNYDRNDNQPPTIPPPGWNSGKDVDEIPF